MGGAHALAQRLGLGPPFDAPRRGHQARAGDAGGHPPPTQPAASRSGPGALRPRRLPSGRRACDHGAGYRARLHIQISGQNHRRLRNVVIHRTYRVDPEDVVEQLDGIRYTSPPRTVFDLASMLTDERLESVIEQVLHDGLATMPTLLATADRLRQRGRRGSARMGRVIASRPAW